MKAKIIATAVAGVALALASSVHAESWFSFEAGIGGAYGQTATDGVWSQIGNPTNSLHVRTPAFEAGLTGELIRHGNIDLRYHADYVYFGQQSSSCSCVPDADYNPHTHAVLHMINTQNYYGSGHVQGVAATLDAGYNYGKWRFGIESGPWVFWETWNEYVSQPGGARGPWIDASHKTVAQLSWVAGANISRGPFALSYRYYNLPQRWNPYPGLLRAAHVLMVTYRF